MQTAQQFVGRFARSIESGWLGKVVAIESFGGETMLRMQGVNELCRMVAGGSLEANLDSDDTQWFGTDILDAPAVKTFRNLSRFLAKVVDAPTNDSTMVRVLPNS